MSHKKNAERVRQAKADLKHVEQQSEKILGAQNEKTEFGDNDPVVVLGKKIGRGIGYVVVIFLIYHLVTTYFIK